MLFQGLDSSGHLDLWVTDGTAAGTSELSVTGLVNPGGLGGDPYFTVFGSKVLFEGDGTDGDNLWVTNGTAAGTSELHPSVTNLGQLLAVDLTAFGNQVLFAGVGVNIEGLWTSDGTSAGTNLISVEGVGVSDITVLGNKALFAGAYDPNTLTYLWVTDGTTQGTSELTVTGENTYVGLSPANITAIGSRALFTGYALTNDS